MRCSLLQLMSGSVRLPLLGRVPLPILGPQPLARLIRRLAILGTQPLTLLIRQRIGNVAGIVIHQTAITLRVSVMASSVA